LCAFGLLDSVIIMVLQTGTHCKETRQQTQLYLLCSSAPTDKCVPSNLDGQWAGVCLQRETTDTNTFEFCNEPAILPSTLANSELLYVLDS
jgi:hypothetical protein